MDRRQLLLLAAAAGAVAALPARAATTWRLASGYRRESFHTVNLLALAADVAAATNGELRLDVQPNGALAKLNDIRAAVEDGRAEAGETIMSSLVAQMPIAGVDSVPFITASYADARHMWVHQRPLVERRFAQRGLQVLYAVPWPPQGLHSTKPIAGVADLKGSRMRSYNPTTARIAALLGAQAVDVPMVEVGQALSEGRIDTMITSAVTGVENQVWSRIRFYYEINAWFPKNIVFCRAVALQALPAAQREALHAAAAKAEARGWAASEAAAASSVDELRRNGVKIERVPHDLNLELKRLGERFSLEWLHQAGGEANEFFIPYFTRPRPPG